ncbi:hypothetical protein OUZ56_011562 [Daphnia magna]|uniref:Uncharacterized protein n=2 Tax=Daphnia magna TaxID=35525 RepID=A0ABQ9Z0U1_9CRUS|nr:hypothetical protein OUZ56_011562 [Daphnia magna]
MVLKQQVEPMEQDISAEAGFDHDFEGMPIIPDEWMKVHVFSVNNKAKIVEYMEKTFYFHDRESTFRFKCVSEILVEYPRFMDCDEGSLILRDFHQKYPDKHFSFKSRFLDRFSAPLRFLAKSGNKNVPKSSDDSMNSLILCLQLMPAVYNVKKASFDSKLDRLFHFVKENASISAIAKAKDVVHHKQPFLIVVGSLEHPLSFNLILDFIVIPLGSDCSRAFNVLFASFFVFRLEFPKHLDKFYLFFEQFVYQIFLGESCYTINPSNQSFANMLDNIASKNLGNSSDAV